MQISPSLTEYLLGNFVRLIYNFQRGRINILFFRNRFVVHEPREKFLQFDVHWRTWYKSAQDVCPSKTYAIVLF
jgi:hypothetical protein